MASTILKLWVRTIILVVAFTAPAFSQDQKAQDSIPPARELVIATANAHQPNAGTAARTESAHDKSHSGNISSTDKKLEKSPGIGDLHPQAIAFVRDYLEENEERLEKMRSWGTPYFRMIDQILGKYNLPTELKYLAVIESNLKPTALSNKGAVGPWQFMPETGRLMGLKIAGSRDDRKDLYKSTHAAARYLRDLYKELGDWLLVIAAYNGGPARVYSAIRKTGSRNFWKLQYHLPAESRNHVKKFIATHFIMEGQGGVTTTVAADLKKLAAQEVDPQLAEGTVTQVVTGKYYSLIVAKTLVMDIQLFSALNPLFDQKVSMGDYTLRLPEEKMDQFNAMKSQILGESVQFMLTNPELNKAEFPEGVKMPTAKKTTKK